MSLARVKELAKAGADGSIRPDELRELWALLPAVIEMAEVPDEATLASESEAAMPGFIRDDGLLCGCAYRAGYYAGVARAGRAGTP